MCGNFLFIMYVFTTNMCLQYLFVIFLSTLTDIARANYVAEYMFDKLTIIVLTSNKFAVSISMAIIF